MRLRPTIAALTLAAALLIAAVPATAGPKFRLNPLARASQPTVITWAPGQPRLLYVAERTGRIRILRNGRFLRGSFLNLSRQVKTKFIEQGLLGLAFPPDYRKTRRFYVHYVDRAGRVTIAEYRRRLRHPRRANPATRRVVLRAPRIISTGGHNGGQLRFHGRQLYIAIGDGNNPGDAHNQAQDLNSLRGKILRIVPRPDPTTGLPYRIPAGNPLVGKPGRDEIFSWGLRNPHTFFFHQPTRGPLHMVIADVGQFRFEEINYLPFTAALGGNFGWKLFEGMLPYDCEPELCPNGGPLPFSPDDPLPGPFRFPALTYSHSAGCAVIAGPVVADRALPALRGRILYGDYCMGRLRSAAPAATVTDDRPVNVLWPGSKNGRPLVTGIGTGRKGQIYLLTFTGPIYRLLERNRRP